MEFRESLELLRRRLDGSLKDHAEKTDYNDIGDIYRLQEYSETHYYMKAVHDYTPAEVEALLSFVDPLEVAFWCREENTHKVGLRDFNKSIQIPLVGDGHDATRAEYNGMLRGQLKKGNNGITKRKYLTFGIEADDLRTAKLRLERIETDIMMNFKKFGVHSQSLDGKERLELLHRQLHPDGQEKLNFSWKSLAETGMSTKDFIAPSGFSLSKDGRSFRVGRHFGAVSFVQILAPELSDQLLADFLQLNDTITVNIHIKSIDQAEAIKNIKRKMSDLQKMKITLNT